MPELQIIIPQADWLRLVLLYTHLMTCAFAWVLVLNADWRIVMCTFTVRALRRIAQQIAWLLILVWLTGLSLIYLDTGFSPSVITQQPKLLIKLLTVVILTLNGFILHAVSFPLVIYKSELSLLQSVIVTVTGALSTSHWLLAAFIGIARPLAQWPLETLLTGYCIYCLATLIAALACTPIIRRRLALQKQNVARTQGRTLSATPHVAKHESLDYPPSSVHIFYDLGSDKSLNDDTLSIIGHGVTVEKLNQTLAV